MPIKYRIQGTQYATQKLGLRLLHVTLEIAYLAEVARILMYARHQPRPCPLQFHSCSGIADDDWSSVFEVELTLNVDEEMRLFFRARHPDSDLETIRFNFEELTFPWLLDLGAHTICTSDRFFDDNCFNEELDRPDPRTKQVLVHRYRQDCIRHPPTETGVR